jgi:hypothetical protein
VTDDAEVGQVYELKACWRLLYCDDMDVLIKNTADGRTELVSRGDWDSQNKTLLAAENKP